MAEFKPKTVESIKAVNKHMLDVFQQVSNEPDRYHLIQHYLYFKESVNANQAADMLKMIEYSVDVVELTGNMKWLTLAGKISLINDEALEDEITLMDRITKDCDGVYDGWEVEIQDGDASAFTAPAAVD